MITLDLVIPTYNRADRLVLALESVAAANVVADMRVRVVVVNNNSTDATEAVVRSRQEAFPLELELLHESVQGRSSALNRGIQASTADLIGMIDDDERIDERWFEVVQEWFAQEDRADFIGGPYLGDWEVPRPNWLPGGPNGALGEIDLSREVQAFGEGFEGMLMGGNAVVRRSALVALGLYRTDLGRGTSNAPMISGEDQDMFDRLLAGGYRGFYVPDLIIHHWIPAERVTKRYLREWTYWNSVGLGRIGALDVEGAPRIARVPRFVWTDTARAWLRTAGSLARLRWEPASAFAAELRVWSLAGYIKGKFERERV